MTDARHVRLDGHSNFRDLCGTRSFEGYTSRALSLDAAVIDSMRANLLE
jgi:hypothetical protein